MELPFPITQWRSPEAPEAPTDFEAIIVDGVPRALTRLPMSDEARTRLMAVPTWRQAEKPRVTPEDVLKEQWTVDMRALPIPSVNQLSYGSCTAGANKGALQGSRFKQGMQHIELSGTWPYAHCNGGRDAGANIGTVVEFAHKYGTCTEAMFPQTVIYPRQARDKAAAEVEAKRFRWAEIYQGAGAADVLSALVCGYDVELAVCVGWGFNVDPTTLQVKTGWGWANHAVWMCGVLIINGQLLILGRNSWGPNWPVQGGSGWFTLSMDQIDNTKAQEIWIMKAPTYDPLEPIGPVVKITGTGTEIATITPLAGPARARGGRRRRVVA